MLTLAVSFFLFGLTGDKRERELTPSQTPYTDLLFVVVDFISSGNRKAQHAYGEAIRSIFFLEQLVNYKAQIAHKEKKKSKCSARVNSNCTKKNESQNCAGNRSTGFFFFFSCGGTNKSTQKKKRAFRFKHM